MTTDRWAVQGCGPDSYETPYGEPVACCGCILTRLSAVVGPITCACRCHETQRFLLRGRR